MRTNFRAENLLALKRAFFLKAKQLNYWFMSDMTRCFGKMVLKFSASDLSTAKSSTILMMESNTPAIYIDVQTPTPSGCRILAISTNNSKTNCSKAFLRDCLRLVCLRGTIFFDCEQQFQSHYMKERNVRVV